MTSQKTQKLSDVFGSLKSSITRDISTLKDRLEVGQTHQSPYEGVGRDVLIHQVNSMKRLLNVNATLDEQGERASAGINKALHVLAGYSEITPQLIEIVSLVTVVDHQISGAVQSIERLRSNMSIMELRLTQLQEQSQRSRATQWVQGLGDTKKFQDALLNAFNKDLQDYYTMGAAAIPPPRNIPTKDIASIDVLGEVDDGELDDWLNADDAAPSADVATEETATEEKGEKASTNPTSERDATATTLFGKEDEGELDTFLNGE